jgi:hypothetical protein
MMKQLLLTALCETFVLVSILIGFGIFLGDYTLVCAGVMAYCVYIQGYCKGRIHEWEESQELNQSNKS